MAVKDVLLLGRAELYEPSRAFERDELANLPELVEDLHDTLMEFRARRGAGRAIAAPQVGVRRRVIYMNVDGAPTVFLNPELRALGPETVEVWDDCLCFPDLLVRVARYASCRVSYHDEDWRACERTLSGDLSELMQHEVDHLDGILAVSRALDGRSFALRGQVTPGLIRAASG